MLGIRTQLRLADFIKAIADTETAVEMTRQVLAEKKGFEPHAAFNYLDRTGNKYLSIADVTSFLNELDLFPTEEEVTSLLLGYSSNEEPRLAYEAFAKLTLPATNPYLLQLVQTRESQNLKAFHIRQHGHWHGSLTKRLLEIARLTFFGKASLNTRTGTLRRRF